MMLLSAATVAIVAWIVVRYVLADNLLAYPVAAALLSLLGSAATLLQNHRADLLVNGIVVIAAALALVVWLVAPPQREARIAA